MEIFASLLIARGYLIFFSSSIPIEHFFESYPYNEKNLPLKIEFFPLWLPIEIQQAHHRVMTS